jgi:hypothetical protein
MSKYAKDAIDELYDILEDSYGGKPVEISIDDLVNYGTSAYSCLANGHLPFTKKCRFYKNAWFY